MQDAEAREHQPRIVHVDAHNRIARIGSDAAEAAQERLHRGDVDFRALLNP
jgi:aspartate 1-decarboxylase